MFNIYRHLRLAGSVGLLIGVLLSNLWITLIGSIFFMWGFMFSIVKMERYIEDVEASQEKLAQKENRDE